MLSKLEGGERLASLCGERVSSVLMSVGGSIGFRAAGLEDLRMGPATPLVLYDDGIGGRTTDRHRLARHQPNHVGPFGPVANDEIAAAGHAGFETNDGEDEATAGSIGC